MTNKKMLIDASHPEETRVVIVSGNRLEDFDVEVESKRQLKGNIYLAKVTRVEPSLQAAFVDYGGNRHGFLAFSEIHPDYYQIPVADREALQADEKSINDHDDDPEPGDDENTVETLGGDDSEEVEAHRPGSNLKRRYKIQEVIKRRQILLIQVVKEERGNKGAALTTYLSLAGRYCVLMPNTARGGGISRKISNGADRKRLKTVLAGLDIPEGMAVIVRTAGSKRSKAEIKRDYEYLTRLWGTIRETTFDSIAPALVHEEANLIKRSIRDLYNKDIEEIIVQGDAGYRIAKNFMKLLIPSHAKKVQPYTDEAIPLTHKYQVESQLDAIHSPDVHLKSGGYIVINPTEALVSIDVNSGRATKERNIEETALKTNMEAASEIARQLKLRDLAGLIVIDFIDMEASRNQIKVERLLKDEMRNDRARIQIGRISPFGLLELSRQRLRPSLIETSSEPCPHCGGTGVRRSTDSTALHILRAIEEEGMQKQSSEIQVFVPTAVALYILNHKRETLKSIETQFEMTVTLENDDTLIPPACRIERTKTNAGGEPVQQSQAQPQQKQQQQRHTETTTSDNNEDGTTKRRRRRRPRRRRKPEEAVESTAQNSETEQTDSKANDTENASDAPVDAAPDQAPENRDDDEAPKKRRRGRRGGRRRGRKTDEQSNADATVVAETTDDAKESADQPAPPLLEKPEPHKELAPPVAGDNVIALPGDQDADKDDSEEAKPKRRRRPRKSKTEVPITIVDDSNTDVVADVTKNGNDDITGPAKEETPAPKRRRGRPRKTDKTTKTDAATADKPDTDKPATENAPKSSQESSQDSPPEPSPEAARTTVINVGDDAQSTPSAAKARKGWWRRLTE